MKKLLLALLLTGCATTETKMVMQEKSHTPPIKITGIEVDEDSDAFYLYGEGFASSIGFVMESDDLLTTFLVNLEERKFKNTGKPVYPTNRAQPVPESMGSDTPSDQHP